MKVFIHMAKTDLVIYSCEVEKGAEWRNGTNVYHYFIVGSELN